MSEQDREMLKLSESLARDITTSVNSKPSTEEKFLGFVPPEVSGIAQAFFSGSFALLSDYFQDKIFEGVHYVGEKHFNLTEEQHLNRNSALIATGAVATVALAPFVTPFMTTRKDQHKEVVDSAKRIAPVLDDIRGKHGVGTFASIGIGDNEVIYAHRKRINARYAVRYTKNFAETLNAVPTIVEKLVGFREFVNGKAPGTIAAKQAATPVVDASGKEKSKAISPNTLVAMIQGPVSMTISAVTGRQQKEFEAKTPAYTALDMILSLEEQINSDQNARDFELPKEYNGRAKSLPLAKYVAEIIRHHQLDMAALDAEYSPVRSGLNNQLEEIAQPIADAIKKGDISTLALVRLVGEGHIVKNKGRSLAKPSDVLVLLEKMSANATAYTQIDPKAYFADAAFNKKELKEALDTLKGEERLHFAAMFPDAVLHDVGMSEADVKQLRAETMKDYESNLGQVLMGLGAEDDKALHNIGFAKEEIKEIRDVVQKVREQGNEAVHAVRAKPNNPGIERLVANAAVGKILAGEVDYFGKISEAGAKLENSPENAEDAAEEGHVSHATKHAPAKRHAGEHAAHAGHAAKENHRRDHGPEHHEVTV